MEIVRSLIAPQAFSSALKKGLVTKQIPSFQLKRENWGIAKLWILNVPPCAYVWFGLGEFDVFL